MLKPYEQLSARFDFVAFTSSDNFIFSFAKGNPFLPQYASICSESARIARQFLKGPYTRATAATEQSSRGLDPDNIDRYTANVIEHGTKKIVDGDKRAGKPP